MTLLVYQQKVSPYFFIGIGSRLRLFLSRQACRDRQSDNKLYLRISPNLDLIT